jgi:hypothetical protein
LTTIFTGKKNIIKNLKESITRPQIGKWEFDFTSPKARTKVTERMTATTGLNILSKYIGSACKKQKSIPTLIITHF